MWDQSERERLQFEESVLNENHPNCEFLLGDASATAKIWHYAGGSWYGF
jgi:hypothetical protein